MDIKVTVLCENTVFGKIGLIAEHGWSVFIETSQGNFLFDTGQGLTLLNNARILKKDLAGVEGIILSHNHGDHTGGLREALQVTGPTKVYAHPQLFTQSFNTRNNTTRYNGIPFNQTALESLGAKFLLNKDFSEIAEGIYLTGEVPRETDFEVGDLDQVLLSVTGESIKDTILSDQSLIISTEDGLFVILGCAHAGIINTLNHAINKTGESRIHTIIGGTHLGMVSDNQREKTIQALKQFNIAQLGVSHCIGFKVSAQLANEFQEKFILCNVGTVVEYT